VWREGRGEERGRDSDMERDECDPLDNSPMLAGLICSPNVAYLSSVRRGDW